MMVIFITKKTKAEEKYGNPFTAISAAFVSKGMNKPTKPSGKKLKAAVTTAPHKTAVHRAIRRV